LAFGEILAGSILIDYGIKAFRGGLSTAQASSGGTTSGPVSTQPAGTTGNAAQKTAVVAAAHKYGVAPETLWGIYGTESSFGADPSTSSAGAQGPFQFIPSTWAQYGNGGNVQDFTTALDAAARLLKALGANSDPNSPQTIRAENNYNGNGGGSSLTSYARSVLNFGKQVFT
jgi:membrane-bound lytic murein transglycosylase B